MLAACSSTTPTTHIASGGGASQGYYKVGRPYQINGVTYTPTVDPNYDETGIGSWYAGAFTGQPTANGELYDPNQLTAAHRTLPMPSLVRVTNLDNGRALIVRVNDRGPYAQSRIIDLSRRCAQLLGFEQKGTAKVRVQVLAKESEALADAARHGQLATSVASAIETNPAQTPPPIVGAPLPAERAPMVVASNMIEQVPLADTIGGEKVVDEKAVIKDETGLSPKGKSEGGRFLPAPVVHNEKVQKTGIFIQAGAFSQEENAAKVRDRLGGMNAQIEPITVNGRSLYRVRIGPLKDVPAADAELNQIMQSGIQDAKIIVE